MQVQSLLRQHNKWKSTPRTGLLREKQGRDAHPERKGVGVPLRRSAGKRRLSHLYRPILPSLYLQPVIWFLFHN